MSKIDFSFFNRFESIFPHKKSIQIDFFCGYSFRRFFFGFLLSKFTIFATRSANFVKTPQKPVNRFFEQKIDSNQFTKIQKKIDSNRFFDITIPEIFQ